MAETDIGRLHDVYEQRLAGILPGRGAGKTYLACHLVAGMAETVPEDSIIAYPLDYMKQLYHMRPMLNAVLHEHELRYTWHSAYVLDANCRIFKFVSVVIADLRGYDYIVPYTLEIITR